MRPGGNGSVPETTIPLSELRKPTGPAALWRGVLRRALADASATDEAVRRDAVNWLAGDDPCLREVAEIAGWPFPAILERNRRYLAGLVVQARVGTLCRSLPAATRRGGRP